MWNGMDFGVWIRDMSWADGSSDAVTAGEDVRTFEMTAQPFPRHRQRRCRKEDDWARRVCECRLEKSKKRGVGGHRAPATNAQLTAVVKHPLPEDRYAVQTQELCSAFFFFSHSRCHHHTSSRVHSSSHASIRAMGHSSPWNFPLGCLTSSA